MIKNVLIVPFLSLLAAGCSSTPPTLYTAGDPASCPVTYEVEGHIVQVDNAYALVGKQFVSYNVTIYGKKDHNLTATFDAKESTPFIQQTSSGRGHKERRNCAEINLHGKLDIAGEVKYSANTDVELPDDYVSIFPGTEKVQKATLRFNNFNKPSNTITSIVSDFAKFEKDDYKNALESAKNLHIRNLTAEANNKIAERNRQEKVTQERRQHSAYVREKWENRLNANYTRGEVVCTYRGNYFGYVDEIDSDRLRVLVRGKFISTTLDSGRVYHPIRNDGYYFDGRYPNQKFRFEVMNSVQWFHKNEVAACDIEI